MERVLQQRVQYVRGDDCKTLRIFQTRLRDLEKTYDVGSMGVNGDRR